VVLADGDVVDAIGERVVEVVRSSIVVIHVRVLDNIAYESYNQKKKKTQTNKQTKNKQKTKKG
jgi:hypothetical protein